MSEPTYRELWKAIFHYEEFDRMPVIASGMLPETRERWSREGLPRDVYSYTDFKTYSPIPVVLPVQLLYSKGLWPEFEDETFEETDEYRIYRQGDGVICKDWKNKASIPYYIEYLLKGEEGWDEYKKRLQPCDERIPADLDARIEAARKSDMPVGAWAGSIIGWLRNWMGVENLGYLCYDNRELLAEMCDTIANLACWHIDLIGSRVEIDTGFGWEDICFRNGPLISPDIFKQVACPAYRKIANKLLDYGCDLYMIDSDGDIQHLVQHWLESGVNIMFPFEIGTWQADPMKLRRKYGKDLRIFGGFNKLEMEKGPEAIDAEIERRIPLMKEGGYIIKPDHKITPGTSLEDYRYYLEKIRKLRL